MRILRRFGLLAAVAVGSAVLAGPALAAFPRPGGTPFTVGSSHFLVHYQSDLVVNPTWAITQTTAGDIAARAERAYAAELADGYAAPLSDGGLGGDNRIDIYVSDLSAFQGVLGEAEWDVNAPQSSGFIELAGNLPDLALDQHTVAHELFHLVQFGVWLPSQVSDYWLLEGSAEWMGYRVNGYAADHPFGFGPSDMALDCRDPLGTNMCDFDTYLNNGYSRWPFFQYLIEHYGNSFVRDIFAQGAAGAPTAIAAVSAALAAKGTTLADVYDAWITADMTGGYSVPALQQLKPVPYATVQTGTESATLSVPKIDVNHLSTRYVKFTRGDGDAAHVCYRATLAVSVALPAGTLSKPAFYWDAKGGSAVPLGVSGSTASATIPWDTCAYDSNAGYLSLPNASTNVDAADFVVTATLTVDKTQPATPAPPPDPIPVNTPVVPVTSVDVAPTLELFGPELLKLSATQTVLRVIVSSNGSGSIQAKLGSIDLGTVSIRGGANDVRLKLPKSALATLRRTASAANLLTLTPVSQSGSVTGQAVTRRVSVAAPAKHAAKKKAAAPKKHKKLARRHK